MNPTSVDDCKTAELHRMLAVQSHGALVAIDRHSGRVVACSRNVGRFLAADAQALLGNDGDALLEALQMNLQHPDRNAPVGEIVYKPLVDLPEGAVCVASHFTREHRIVELEWCEPAQPSYSYAERKTFMEALERADSAEGCARILMREVARLTDFDRVMLYRFLPNWHGEVIAEQNKPGVPGFYGLRFPAGDIPANARRLYTVNLERSVADVGAAQVPIDLAEGVSDLDLSWSQLRAVHPVHLTYLGNIGAQASFSLSIVSEGRLWGMVACHHLAARRLSMPLRRNCEDLTRLAAMQMTSVARVNVERESHGYRAAIYEIRGSLHASMLGFPAIEAQIAAVRKLFSATGVWQHFNGRDHWHGAVPGDDSRPPLRQWVDGLDRNGITAFNAVPEALADDPELVRRASGMLFIPLNERDFILVFRPEEVEEVIWAGRPDDLGTRPGEADALTPRTSFLKWAQSVRGRAQAWTTMQVEAAGLLRQELIDYLQRCQVERQAHADPLTGLANRLLFDQELERTVEEVGQSGGMFAVLMIDLDKFKPVNDSLGHAAGDELLIQVARRLAAMVRTEDTVARLGGDEFTVILRQVSSVDDAQQIAARMVAEIRRPFDVFGEEARIGVSIGVCPWMANEPLAVHELLERADVALYAAKRAGRSRQKLFEPAMLGGRGGGASELFALQAGLQNGEFELRYQPIIETAGRRLAGFEAYCFWRHPERGELGASEFRHLMAHQTLMEGWTRWCLRQLFAEYRERQRQGAPEVPLGINISAAQFMRLDLAAICAELAGEYRAALDWLSLDLDEQALGSSLERATDKIEALARLGAGVNIDHFGRGAILLRQLAGMKLKALKFSAAELRDDAEHADGRLEIKRAIAGVLGVPLVATHIETLDAVDWAAANRIDFIQGYAVSQPLDADAARDWP